MILRVAELEHRFVIIDGKKRCRFCGLVWTIKNETSRCSRMIPENLR